MRRGAVLLLLLLVLATIPLVAGPVTLLSRADPERPSGTAGGTSEIVAVSADGRYVVFLSSADNLLPGVADTNMGQDVFFHDRVADTTILVSHAADEPSITGDGGSPDAALSADGRWVAFQSVANNLVAGQVEEEVFSGFDVFLWDRDTGVTTLASHRPGLPTTATDFTEEGLSISADGSQIAFLSYAPDLIAGQSGDGSLSVFLYDRAADMNTLVSHRSGNLTSVTGVASLPVVSADGNWVVFVSSATDLVTGQVETNGENDLFLYHRATGSNVLVSHAPGSVATAANDESFSPQISADDNWIAYASFATNLMAGQADINSQPDVFLFDRATGTSNLVSHTWSSATTAGDRYASMPAASADGRYIAFESRSSNLVAGAPGLNPELFVYDRISGTNAYVSRQGSTPANGYSSLPRVSSDGAWIAFRSYATNLVAGQTDPPASQDVFLWSRASGSISLVTRTPGSATTSAGGYAQDLRISADGSWIALASGSVGLVDGIADHNNLTDVFLYERAAGVHHLLTSRGGAASASAGGTIAYGSGSVMSNDGRYFAFTTKASNLPGITDGNNAYDIFLYDRVTGTLRLVSHADGFPSTTGDGDTDDPLMSTDGTVLVFGSRASNLVPGPISQTQLYLYDRSTSGITLVSHAAASSTTPSTGVLGDGSYAVSGDGRWIAYAHTGSDLVAGQESGHNGTDIFLFDRATGTNTLVSHANSSPAQTGNNFSSAPVISADGRYLVFESRASNLVPGQVGAGGIFLFDRVTGANTRVSSSGAPPLAISTDGRWVVFLSSATDVVPGQVDTNSRLDVFLWDRISGSTLLVSHTPASPITTGNGISSFDSLGSGGFRFSAPVLSANGRWVTFLSAATNLVVGQAGAGGLFLFDRITGTVTLVSRPAASPTFVRDADEPAISADGRFVTFLSQADDLVPGQVDQNSGEDVFLYDRIAGTTALVSHVPSSEITSGVVATAFWELPWISADGAWVAFSSASPDLVADDHDGVEDAFLYANLLPGRDLFTVSPCRLVDTRVSGQGPALSSGVKRTLVAPGLCGIPATARAVVANVTIIQPTGAGYLTFHAGDIAPETASTITFAAGQTRSNNAILPLAFDGTGVFAVTPFVGGNGTVHLAVDVSGWFE